VRTYILDAYNVIFSIKELERHTELSLESARDALFHFCDAFLEARKDTRKIHIVFDGKSEYAHLTNDSYGRINVLYTATGESADDAIIGILGEMKSLKNCYVVSNDNYVRNHARVYGVHRMSVAEFETLRYAKNRPFAVSAEMELSQSDAIRITEEYKKHLNL